MRFIMIIGAWPFAMKDARTFAFLYAGSYILAIVQGPLSKILGQQSFYGMQLDILNESICYMRNDICCNEARIA